MKKVTLLVSVLSFLVIFPCFAQKQVSPVNVNRGVHSKPGSTEVVAKNNLNQKVYAVNPKNLSASTVVCNTPYVAGTTMDLNFTVTISTTDFEYGDSLSLIFPSDFIINSATDTIAVATEGQNPETLNPLSGQQISWGDNDNNYGGIEPGVHNFIVNVTIAPVASGNQMVDWYISGDQYANPMDASGTLALLQLVQFDAGVIGFTSPVTASSCGFGSAETIGIAIMNFGIDTITGIPVSFTVDGANLVSENYTGTILPGDTAFYTFTGTADLTGYGVHTITAFTELTGDGNPQNDSSSASVNTIIPYPGTFNMGFEATEDLTGWGIADINNDASSWSVNATATYANTGSRSITYTYNLDSAANDWLFTNCISLDQTKTYRFNYYFMARSATYPEKMAVYIGTSPDPASMTTLVFDNGTFINTTFQLTDTTFSVPANGVYYIGFHATSDANMYNIYVDDISLSEVFVNDLAAISLTVPQKGTNLQGTIPLQVVVMNSGADSIPAGKTITIKDNGTAIGTFLTPAVLMSGETDTIQYDWNANTTSTYLLTAEAENDDNNTNNISPSVITYIYDADYEIESFEGSVFPPANWDSPGNWAMSTTAANAYEGLQYAYSTTGAVNSRLITPLLTVTAVDSLSFYGYTAATTNNPTITMQYSADKVSWTDIGSPVTLTTASTRFASTTGVAGNYYFSFTCNNPSTTAAARMDLVAIPPRFVLPPDAGVTNIVTPSNTSACSYPAASVITVEVTNFSADTLAGIPVNFTVDGSGLVSETTGTVNPGQTITYTFTGTADLSGSVSHQVVAYSTLANDTITNNDSTSITYTIVAPANIPYSLGFETTEDISGLGIIDANSDSFTWGIDTAGDANTGTRAAVYSYNTASAANDWIVMPCINLVAGTDYKVEFFYKVASASWPENLAVYFGTSPDTISLSNLIVDLPGLTNTTYSQSSTNFTVPADAVYYFAFKSYSDADMFNLFIDDILITEATPNDAGVISANIPAGTSCELGTFPVEVSVVNFGTDTLASVDVNFVINAGNVITETIAGPVAGGDTVVYTFTTQADFSNAGNYDVVVYTSVTGDIINNNDTFSVNIVKAMPSDIPYTLGFETGEPVNWTIVDANVDDTTWNINTSATYSHTGTNSATYNYNTASAANDWLITTCLNLNAGSLYSLKYYFRARSASWPEKMAAYIGTLPDTAALSTLLYDNGTFSNITYQLADTAFTVPVSGVYYIGFHATSDADMFNIYLDDISITEIVPVDLGVIDVSLTSPRCDLGGIAVTASIVNNGTDTVTNFDLTYTVNGTSPVTENYTGILAPQDTMVYTFLQQAASATPGDYIIEVTVNASGDAVASNNQGVDTTSNLIPATVPYFTSFDNASDRLGWSITDANLDTYTWGVYQTNGVGGSPAYGYSYNVNNAADDFLFSTCIDMNAGANYRLNFNYATQSASWPEKVRVLLATGQNVNSVIDTIVDLGTISNTAYDTSNTAFSVPATGTYYLVYHVYSDADMFRAYIDNVSVYEEASAVISGATAACAGDSAQITVTLNGVQPWDIVYTDGTNNYTANGITTSPYTVTVLPAATDTFTLVSVADANGPGSVSGSAIVTVGAGPSLSFNPVNPTCHTSADGTIDLTVTGDAPYTYQWSNGATTEDISNLDGINYTVTVTDANGCSANNGMALVAPDSIVAGYISTNPACGATDGSIDITVTGGTPAYTFIWSNAAVTEDLTGIAAGVYTVTITDANNCTASETIALNNQNAPTVNMTGVMVSCSGLSDGSAIAEVTGGTAPYSFAWSSGTVDNDTLANIPAGNYMVTVTDASSCIVINNFDITEPAALAITVNSTDILCNGDSSGSAMANVSGGTTSYSYNWSNGATTQSITGLVAGSYFVTVTDGNNCVISDSAIITEPASNLSLFFNHIIPYCNGDSTGSITATANGGTQPYSYNWSNGATTQNISGLTAGVYTLTLSDNNGCSIVRNDTLIDPIAIVANISNFTNVTCFGGNDGSATVSVSGGYAPYVFSWNTVPPQSTNSVSGLTAGVYCVTVVDANICQSVTCVTITEPAVLDVQLTSGNPTCNGNSDGWVSATVTGGTPPYTYVWNNGSVTQDQYSLASGTYCVTVYDSNACMANACVTLTEPAALSVSLTPTGDDGSCNGSIATSVTGGNPPYTYSWSNAGTTQDLTGLCAGVYTVTITDASGCTIVDSADVILIGISILNERVVSIYPNPAKDIVNIVNADNATVSVYNMNGALLLREDMKNPFVSLDLNNFENANYLIRIVSGTKVYQKIITLQK